MNTYAKNAEVYKFCKAPVYSFFVITFYSVCNWVIVFAFSI